MIMKIISNPYEKKTSFKIWDFIQEQDKYDWVSITHTDKNYESSKLINYDIKEGFFPFKACEILDILQDSFYTPEDQELEIEFEGTDDEFNVLEKICLEKDIVW